MEMLRRMKDWESVRYVAVGSALDVRGLKVHVSSVWWQEYENRIV